MLQVLVIVLIIFVICLVNFFFTQSESDNEYLGLFPSSRLQRSKNTLKGSFKKESKSINTFKINFTLRPLLAFFFVFLFPWTSMWGGGVGGGLKWGSAHHLFAAGSCLEKRLSGEPSVPMR